MKKTLLIPVVAFSFLFFAHVSVFAQNDSAKNFYVELIVPDKEHRNQLNKFKLAENYNFYQDSGSETPPIGGIFATTDCSNCSLTSSYQFWIFKAEKVKNEKLKLKIDVSFENQSACNTRKTITVNYNKKETVSLKCGVTLVTYPAS